MKGDPEVFDENDQIYLASMLDEGDIPMGVFSVVQYVNAEGEFKVKKHVAWGDNLQSLTGAIVVGLIEEIVGAINAEGT